MAKYELHITVEGSGFPLNEEILRHYARVHKLGFSKIVGWDELGEGDRMYLTWYVEQIQHKGLLAKAKAELQEHIATLLVMGQRVVRGKIEECHFDWRIGGDFHEEIRKMRWTAGKGRTT